MSGFSIMQGNTRERISWFADILVAAIAASLPWSTSATAILAVLWVLVLVPTLHWRDLRQQFATAAGGFPVLLVALGVAGMLWADVSFTERLNGIDSFIKLLTVPLLLAQFQRSGRGRCVFFAYLGSCSQPMKRRPRRLATAPVVPVPQNGSSTRSSGRELDRSTRASSASGFCVG